MASNQDDTTVQVNKDELRRAGDLVSFTFTNFNLLNFAPSLFRFFFFVFLRTIPHCATVTRRVPTIYKATYQAIKA